MVKNGFKELQKGSEEGGEEAKNEGAIIPR